MNLRISAKEINPNSKITISGSKSETNRLLLLQAFYPNIVIENASNSDDSKVMSIALMTNSHSTSTNAQTIDVIHAGTAMRFLAAYFASQEGKTITLTGSSRMKERPIKILVDALKQLGAKIEYLENEGFPPIKIIGQKIIASQVSLQANVSSQYISALLLIAPKLENGLELKLIGEITSVSYIKMTLKLLQEIGVETSFKENLIIVKPKIQNPSLKTIIIESDWSSASYFYSIIALSKPGTQIVLSSFKENSLQGDAVLASIYKEMGVETHFDNGKIILIKSQNTTTHNLVLNLNNSPDIAQTIAVTAFGLGIGCLLTGLQTLKIKETDRLEALKVELSKLGAIISVSNESLQIEPSQSIQYNQNIATYNDHRMAMAFAPLALKSTINIENTNVVSKSYPNFWNDLRNLGFEISEY
jgi:3-phosphoshikimate 1-carboxyvinyltransferase